MNARIIEQINGEPGLLLEPTSPLGEFIGAVIIPSNELILDVAKKMLLVSKVSSEKLAQSSSSSISANMALDYYLTKSRGVHEGDFNITNGAEGIIMDRYDKDQGSVNGLPLVLNSFREVVLY